MKNKADSTDPVVLEEYNIIQYNNTVAAALDSYNYHLKSL